MAKFISGVLLGVLTGGLLVLALGRKESAEPMQLDDENPEPRYQDRPLSAWLNQLQRSDPLYREEAVTALQNLAASNPTVMKALARAAQDNDPDVRILAISALGRITPRIEALSPLLLAALNDENRVVRIQAAQALANLGPPSEAILSGLIQALGDRDETVRLVAVQGLARMGPAARRAGPALARLLREDPSHDLRKHAAEALEKIDPDAKQE
jgi:HEAT repeat protein